MLCLRLSEPGLTPLRVAPFIELEKWTELPNKFKKLLNSTNSGSDK